MQPRGEADAAAIGSQPSKKASKAQSQPPAESVPSPGPQGAVAPAPVALHRQAVTAIAETLDAIPVLYASLAKQPAVIGAVTAADIAERLCAAQGDFPAALEALVTALPEASRQLRQRGEDPATLRRRAQDILGWMAVTTVLDGYDREGSERIQRAWVRFGAFHIPLGRSPCIEVLTARWRGGKAEFSMEPKRYDYGRYDITPERFGEIGFDDPRRLDHERAVSYVWRRVYQDVYGGPAPERLPPSKIGDLRAWLNLELKKNQRRRLVIDRYDLDQAFAFESTLQAIHDAIPQIHLIVIDSGATVDPGVFALPASDLAAGIFDCLRTIEALA